MIKMIQKTKTVYRVILFTLLAMQSWAWCDEAQVPVPEVAEVKAVVQKTALQKLADINMRSFPWEKTSWGSNTFVEYMIQMRERTLKPMPREKRYMMFELFKSIEKRNGLQTGLALDDAATWEDLQLFCGKSDAQNFLANVLDRTSSEYGKISLYLLLAQPTADVELLKNRQKIVQNFVYNQELRALCDQSCKNLQQAENVTLFFWNDDHFKRNAQDAYFPDYPGIKKLNESDIGLLFKGIYNNGQTVFNAGMNVFATVVLTTYGLMAASKIIAGTAVPERLKKSANCHTGDAGATFPWLWEINNPVVHALVALTAGAFCAERISRDVDWVRGQIMFDLLLQTFMMHVAQTTNALHALYQIIKKDPVLEQFAEFKPITELYEQKIHKIPELKEFLEKLECTTFQGEASFFSDKGVILRAFALMYDVREHLEDALAAAGSVDAYLSCAKLYKEYENTTHSFSFAQFATSEKPLIKLENFWHPMVNPEKVIANSVTVGTDGQRPNIIVTGPNEGGKSTMLKAITVAVMMAQTIGMVPAHAMTLTPFSSIATYLNITDDIGAGNSLFKAEVLRTQQLIERVQGLKDNEFCFAVFDEVFNGTSPVEGQAAAYSVAKYLGSFDKSINIVATHFNLLTKLEQETDVFTNYKVSVNHFRSGQIEYPYKFERGISDQHVALDILRNQGFASSILDDAQRVVNQQ
jgi:DNA mismatch repair protein MutS